MNYRIITTDKGVNIINIEDKNVLISDEQSALDVFMTLAYETGENIFIISKENLTEGFFNLSNKIAGNILQKLINYRMKLAIVGDFSVYNSKALRDFIYECNNGKDILFVENEETAINMLNR